MNCYNRTQLISKILQEAKNPLSNGEIRDVLKKDNVRLQMSDISTSLKKLRDEGKIIKQGEKRGTVWEWITPRNTQTIELKQKEMITIPRELAIKFLNAAEELQEYL